jgi:uncharacterized NAD(P)/FAD-binding protein YdhS
VLLEAAAVDDAVAEALLAKKNRRIEAAIAEASAAAMAEDVVHVLDARSVAISEADREHILSCRDPGQLKEWMGRAAVAIRREDIFGPRR